MGERLTRLEDLYLDGGMSRARYVERRDAYEAEAADVRLKLTERPPLIAPDIGELFGIAEALEGTAPDYEEWREITHEVVDRIVIGKRIEVEWKPSWRSLLTIPLDG